MESKAWFNTEQGFAPGRELFRSQRRFQLWAQTVSHGQLLFRAVDANSELSRIDLMFKPVTAMKVRHLYDGLVVRCATDPEAEVIRESTELDGEQVLVLETGGSPDFVACYAFGWYEDDGTYRDPSRFAGTVDEGAQPWSHAADAGLAANAASLADLTEAVQQLPERSTYRYVYVLMYRLSGMDSVTPQGSPTSVFLTRGEAEREQARRAADPDSGGEWWIETAPVGV